MTAMDYLTQITNLITNYRPAKNGPFLVVVVDKKIIIAKTKYEASMEKVLLRLTAADINVGLKSWQWDMVHRRIIIMIREGVLK